MRKSFRRKSTLLLLAGAAVVGCSAQQCDPGKADFFSGAGCAVNGYHVRDQQLDANLTKARADLAAAQSQAATEHAAAASATVELTTLQQELAEQSVALEEQRRQIDAATLRRGVDSERARAARGQLAALRQQLKAAQNAPTQQQLDEIRKRQAALRRLVQDM